MNVLRILGLSSLLFLIGCISQWTPEAQVALAERQISIRLLGMTAVEPQTGIIFCILCGLAYERNTGQPATITKSPAQAEK